MTAPAEYTEETTDPSETVEAPQTDTADVAVTSEEGGVLILGGTPIGNLADASDRLRSALATADLIAVEDTLRAWRAHPRPRHRQPRPQRSRT